MFSDEFIERVRSNSNLQRLFEAKGIQLKKQGVDLVCRCPFHSDKNPSLHVSPGKGLWNCFGCGEGGDAIQFVRRSYGYSFREAIEFLANEANIPIEQEEQLTEAQRQEQQKREVLLNAMDVVADFYVSTLWDDKSEDSKKALEIASNRWDKEFLQQYRIGFAPSKYDALIKYAATKGISAELLIELGMARYSKNNHLIDVFRNRIMIPIRKRSGRYVAFTGRTIKSKEGDDTPKYINNTNTPLFNKDTTVFGMDVAAGPAIHADVMYLVEGAPDVLRLHLNGIKNVVACLGSAWTENQLRQIKQCTTKLCFIPDADPPNTEATNIRDKQGIGIQAVIKNAKLALKLGFNVKVKEIPVGEKHDSVHRTTYFKQEEDRIFAWEHDVVDSLEMEIKSIRNEILRAERDARNAQTVAEKLTLEKKVEELKRKRRRLRNELEEREDEVSAQRKKMIGDLEKRMIQSTASQDLFTIRFTID